MSIFHEYNGINEYIFGSSMITLNYTNNIISDVIRIKKFLFFSFPSLN